MVHGGHAGLGSSLSARASGFVPILDPRGAQWQLGKVPSRWRCSWAPWAFLWRPSALAATFISVWRRWVARGFIYLVVFVLLVVLYYGTAWTTSSSLACASWRPLALPAWMTGHFGLPVGGLLWGHFDWLGLPRPCWMASGGHAGLGSSSSVWTSWPSRIFGVLSGNMAMSSPQWCCIWALPAPLRQPSASASTFSPFWKRGAAPGFTNFAVFVILAVLYYTMAWAAPSSLAGAPRHPLAWLMRMMGHFGSQGDGLLWGHFDFFLEEVG